MLKRPSFRLAAGTAALAVLMTGRIAARPAGRDAGKLPVFVSIPPEAYFVERVGGGRVRVSVLVGPGREPHNFEPTPKQLVRLGKARLYFAIGFPFEDTLVRKIGATFRNLRFVNIRRGVSLRYMTAAGRHHHHGPAETQVSHGETAEQHDSQHDGGHGTEAEDARGYPDPHTWMSPRNVKIMARNIAHALEAEDPAGAELYRANLQQFLADLDAVDREIAAALAPVKGREVLVFHPAFGYFTEAYGLKQVAVELGGRAPTARRLAELIARARRDRVRVIFVQPQFSTRTAQAVAKAIHGAVVPMDPLARDYLDNLRSMARKVRKALSTR
ncbi:MAG: zinc ABC transporter solute-binding protein [Kiritimatiellaeota bacterium]|nr:zinc ABC transporter solute-binding protein [Kiritimatiellota bacterium]